MLVGERGAWGWPVSGRGVGEDGVSERGGKALRAKVGNGVSDFAVCGCLFSPCQVQLILRIDLC